MSKFIESTNQFTPSNFHGDNHWNQKEKKKKKGIQEVSIGMKEIWKIVLKEQSIFSYHDSEIK